MNNSSKNKYDFGKDNLIVEYFQTADSSIHNNYKSHKLINDFLKQLKRSGLQENIYLLNHANYFISEIILKDIPYFLSESQEDINKKYTDITKTIINFNPIGLRNNNGHLSEDESILTCLNLINEDGMGIFYYPSFIRFKNRLFRKITENEYFVNSIINLPESFNSPCTALKGILLFISRVETPNIYFSEFDTLEPNISQIEHVANEVISQLNFDFSTGFPASYEVVAKDMFDDSLNNDEVDEIEDLWHGVRRSFNDFKSFEYFKAQEKIRGLNSVYKNFNIKPLSQISKKINRGYPQRSNLQFEELENAIYIPIIRAQPCDFDRKNIKAQDANIFQICVDIEIIDAFYLLNFLNSEHGKALLDGCRTGLMNQISGRLLNELPIPLPSLAEQKKISETFKKIKRASEEFDGLKNNLLMNPTASNEIEKLEDIIDAIGKLTEAEKIKGLIRKHKTETNVLEFKETFDWDVRKQVQGKYLRIECIKTMAGFFNADGGYLLIGVNDNGEITGIETEILKLHKTKDNFLKHLKNKFTDELGKAAYALYETKLISIDNKDIICIDCKKSEEPFFTKDQQFYVRTTGSTELFEAKELIEFIAHHWPKKN